MVKIHQLLYLIIMLYAAACSTVAPTADSSTPLGSVEMVTSPALTPEPTVTATLVDYPWTDESALVSGICFEAASDMATMNRRFLLHNAEEHVAFYDAIDHTNLCLRPVERMPFDFSAGRTLAGLWSAGRGCTAQHQVLAYSVEQNTLNIMLHFLTQGDCNYELVRAFWISFDSNLTLNLTIADG
ncbi:MAG: hypothetical protein U0694_10865 [Anaerolineae bacterium]